MMTLTRLLGVVLASGAVALDAQDALPRRVMVGLTVEPAPTGPGLVVRAVSPGSAGQAAGVMPNDILLRAAGFTLATSADLIGRLRSTGDGKPVVLELLRAGKPVQLTVTPRVVPRETSPDFTFLYSSVGTAGQRRRVIATVPKGRGPFPTVMLLGGIGCYSLDVPALTPTEAYTSLLYGLTRAGFATIRVEKSGIGDSEGPPCPQAGFQSEWRGYRDAARSLGSLPFVDTSRVFLVGHSIGGIGAPLLAREVPVRGVIAIATVAQSWLAYDRVNAERQYRLGGMDASAIARVLAVRERCTRRLLVARERAAAIVASDTTCKEYVEYPVSDVYMQELAALDLPSLWREVRAPVLAVYPGSDFVSSLDEHQALVRTVNERAPGRAELLVIAATDHYLSKAASPQESFARAGRPGSFNPAVTEQLVTWLRARAAMPPGAPRP